MASYADDLRTSALAFPCHNMNTENEGHKVRKEGGGDNHMRERGVFFFLEKSTCDWSHSVGAEV